MSDFYAGMRDDVAIPLITKYGQVISLIRFLSGSEPAFDPVTGEYTSAGTPTEYSGYGITKKYTADSDNDIIVDEDGETVQGGLKSLVAVEIPRPLITDKIKIGDVTYNIGSIDTVSPAGTDIVQNLVIYVKGPAS